MYRYEEFSDYEIHRNNLIYNNYQSNRNPFIDFPSWADIAFGSSSNYANVEEYLCLPTDTSFPKSKYSFFRLLRLNFDLMTSFSIAPLQMVTMSGMAISLLSFIFFLYMMVRRIVVGSEADGVFTLMALNFFLFGITIMALGVIGEYTGRIYKQIQQRPHYVIRHIYEENAHD